MTLINNKYTEIDDSKIELLQGALTLSYLMTDAGERKDVAFFSTTALLKPQVGSFHIFTVDQKPVAYALLSFGSDDNPSARRLCYFAVERQERSKGYATQALELLIKEEVDLNTGISTSCHPELREFYEKLGFEYVCVSEGCNNEYITMALVDQSVMSANNCADQIVALTQMAPDAESLFEGVKKMLKSIGVRPPKNKKKK